MCGKHKLMSVPDLYRKALKMTWMGSSTSANEE
jgi:hypothetical protein